MIALDELRRLMPSAGSRAAAFVEPLNDAMLEFSIDNPLREAAFLAQVAHESGELNFVRELWGPIAAQVRYERDPAAPWPASAEEAKQPAFERNRLAFTLGNTEVGDGKTFRGRGLIQITGRSNYRECGAALGADLVGSPVLLEQPGLAARSAAWFWKTHGLNELADKGDFLLITKRINGGTNGYDKRVAFYAVAKKIFQGEYA
jgi:putative chitinase